MLTALSFSFLVSTGNAVPLALRSGTTQTYHKYIGQLSSFAICGNYSEGEVLFGNVNVTGEGNRDVEFFIFDSSNYQNWTNGQSEIYLTFYLYHYRVTNYSWAFKVPYSDTWYIVFNNKFSLSTGKYVDILYGVDGKAPIITISSPDLGDHVSGTVWINASAIVSNRSVYNMSIEIDGTPIKTEYNGAISCSWDSASTSNGQHTITVKASDGLGNSNGKNITVYVSNAPINTGGGSPISLIDLIGPGFGILVVAILIAIVVSRIRERRPEPPETVLKPTRKVMKPVGKEVVETQPGLCPHCGAKTVPGATFCRNCGANLEE